MENIAIGALGWLHPKWDETFYPEEMPTDWKLDFYSNQFSTCLLPIEQFMMLGDDQVEEIVEALEGEDFFIYLMFEQLNSVQKIVMDDLLSRITAMKPFIKGALFHSDFEQSDLSNAALCLAYFKEHQLKMTWFGSKEAFLYSLKKGDWSCHGFEDEGAERKMSFWGEPMLWIAQIPETQDQQIALLNGYGASLSEDVLGAPIFFGDPSKNYYADANQLAKLKLVAEFLGL